MELLRQELAERPTAERALRSLGEAVGLSRSTISRQLRSAPYDVVAIGNDRMAMDASITAFLVNSNGIPNSTGTGVQITNATSFPAFVGLNGVMNVLLAPGETKTLRAAHYRSANDNRPVAAQLTIAWWRRSS